MSRRALILALAALILAPEAAGAPTTTGARPAVRQPTPDGAGEGKAPSRLWNQFPLGEQRLGGTPPGKARPARPGHPSQPTTTEQASTPKPTAMSTPPEATPMPAATAKPTREPAATSRPVTVQPPEVQTATVASHLQPTRPLLIVLAAAVAGAVVLVGGAFTFRRKGRRRTRGRRPHWYGRRRERLVQGRPSGTVRHRDDLQGLRAVAVLLVALGHAHVHFLQGGFVGVDVFFVLSGFLITGLLLSGAAKLGYVSFADFYVRRARRILPAAALTLVVTALVAFWVLNFVRAKQVIWDSVWASLFAANIHFAHEGTDYFAQGQPASPVEHFWSLAVEEQFYVVWPALMSLVLFGLVVGRRSRRRARPVTARAVRRLLVVVLAVAIASLAWSIHYTKVLPTAAYFSTFARAWELALGAAIALGASKLLWGGRHGRLIRFARALRTPIGWLGLIGIAGAGVAFSASTPFPGSAALLPTIGAALVIAAGLGEQRPRFGVGRLLAIGPLRYVGDRSYTFYLWHWPALIIAGEYAGHDLAVRTQLLLLVGAFALSVITYALYEDPIRRAAWSPPASAMLWPASVAAVVFVAAFTLQSINATASRLQRAAAPPAPALLADPKRAAAAAKADSRRAVAAVTAGRALPSVVASVKAADRGARIPLGLTPPVGGLLDHENSYFFPAGCSDSNPSQSTSTICRLGDASSARSIVVMGDSHAQMWMPAILSMAAQDGWVVLPLVKSGCVPNTTWVSGSDFGIDGTRLDAQVRVCRAWYGWALRQVARLKPDVVLIAGSSGGANGQQAEAIKRGVVSLTAALKRYSKNVAVVADDDGIAESPVDCLLARHATMRSCTTRWGEDRFYLNNDLAALAKSHGFDFIATRGWFCFESQCPAVIGRTIAYRDTGHLTKAYALDLAAPFRAAFRRAIR